MLPQRTERPLLLGDWVRLKTGNSPHMLVVDAMPNTISVMVAYRVHNQVNEWALRRDELRRVKSPVQR
jgi:hypothetical protein